MLIRRAVLLAVLCLLVTGLPVTVVLMLSPPDVKAVTPMTKLTHGEGTNLDPNLSPDGRRIAFSSNRSGSFDIWLMDTYGRKLVRLTSMPGDEVGPRWSPDGKEIAFLSVERQTGIWVMNLVSLRARQLIEATEVQNDFEWSPNSLMLVYESKTAGNWTISTVDAFGHRTQLTAPDCSSKYPSWSPDGRQIVFSSNRLSRNYEIWILNTDGNGLKQLTTASGFSIKPRINPLDGRVLFLSNRSNYWDLWVMNADGTNQSQVLTPYGEETMGWRPAVGMDSDLGWSPDGLRMIFSSTRADRSAANLFMVQPPGYEVVTGAREYPSIVAVEDQTFGVTVEYAGAPVTRLSTPMSPETKSFMDDFNPCWSRDGKRIVFQSGHDGNFDIWLISFERSVTSYR